MKPNTEPTNRPTEDAPVSDQFELDLAGSNAELGTSTEETVETETTSLTSRVQETAEHLVYNSDTEEYELPEELAEEHSEYAELAVLFRQSDAGNTGLIRHKALEKSYKKRLNKLVDAAVLTAPLNLSSIQQDELDDLRVSDPDKWRRKLNLYETEARKTLAKEMVKAADEDGLSLEDSVEEEVRVALLAEYNKKHPEAPITDKVIADRVPPGLVRKLAEGKITFAAFIKKVSKYVGPKAKATNTKIKPRPNLSTVGGRATETKPAKKATKYEDVIF